MPWTVSIYPYLKSTQIYICPSNSKKAVAYTYNVHFTRVGTASPYGQRKLAGIELPAQTPAFIEADGVEYASTSPTQQQALIFQLGTGGVAGRKIADPAAASLTWQGAATDGNPDANRHLEGANYAFADSHVKWLKQGTLPDNSFAASNGLDYNCDGILGTTTTWN
jgi:prepilin-type processing-associated H-X9-DG protein